MSRAIWKGPFRVYAYSKGHDQAADPRSLNRAFAARLNNQ